MIFDKLIEVIKKLISLQLIEMPFFINSKDHKMDYYQLLFKFGIVHMTNIFYYIFAHSFYPPGEDEEASA